MDRTYRPSSGSLGSPATRSTGERDEATLSFAGLRLQADGSLFRGEVSIHLPPRELAALRLLLANAGQIVTPAQFKKAIWEEVHVTPESVPRCLSSLRARLQPQDCIQTVYKRGYRLVGEVLAYKPGPGNSLPRLAIPPFDTDEGVPEHLGTAIAEETIARLSNARRPLASILARDSVFALSQHGRTAQEIGHALCADLVLAGNLRLLPAHFRLRVEMIRVLDGVQIWVDDLLVERSGIARLESELTGRLEFRLNAGPLHAGEKTALHLSSSAPSAGGAGETPVPEGGAEFTPSPEWSEESFFISAAAEPARASESDAKRHEAYEIFLRGHHEWQTLERHRMQDGMQHLMRASELDPTLIAAKVDLAHLAVYQAFHGYMSPTVSADLVRRTAESIPDFPGQGKPILLPLAWIHLHFDRDLPAALQAMEHSSHLPHDAWITRVRTMVALSRYRFSEAIDLARGALLLDSFSPWLHARLAWAHHLAGNGNESIEQIERALRLFPDFEGTALYGSIIFSYHGDAERGVQLAQDQARRQPSFDLAAAVLAYALACAGRADEARGILDRLNWLGKERFVIRSFTPAVHVALGDLDAALSELNAANEARCPWFLQMLADPRLKPLHGHPEVEQLRAIVPRMEGAVQKETAEQAGPASAI